MLELAFLLLFISLAYVLHKPPFKLFIFAFPVTILFAFFEPLDPFVRLEFLSMGLFAAFSLFLLGVFTDLDFFVIVVLSMLVSGRAFGYPVIIPIAGLLFLLRILAGIGTELGMLSKRFGSRKLLDFLLDPVLRKPFMFVLNTFFFLFLFVNIYFFASLLGKPGIGPLLVLFVFIFLKDILSGKYRRHIMAFIFLFGGYLVVMEPSLLLHEGTVIFFAFVLFMVTYMQAYWLVDTKLSHEVKVSQLREGMILKGQYQEVGERVLYYPDAITAMRESLQKGMAKGFLKLAMVMRDYMATEAISGMLTNEEISRLKAWVRADKIEPKVYVRTTEPRSVSFVSVLMLVLLLGYFRILI